MSKGHGIVAENTVEAICHRLFGPDLVMRSPTLVEVSGAKELTDVLVLIDDTAIIIQSKSLALDAADLDDTSFGRIASRHARAKTQINTTLNAEQRQAKVRASTPFGVAFDVDWTRIRYKVGLITLSVPDSAYADPEFRFQYPNPVEKHKGIDVHTFLIKDLARAAAELTTPADVLLYLKARTRCFRSTKFIIGNELDFLAFFKTQYPKIERALSDPEYHVLVTPGFWEDYRRQHTEKICDRSDRLRNSVLIDRLINRLRTAVEYSVTEYGLTPQESAIQYLSVIGKLNKLTRMERAKIGDKLLQKFEKTKAHKWGYFVHVSQLTSIGYLFLLLNEDDVEKRRVFLYHLCKQACRSAPCRELVGIASEGAQQTGFSIDAIVMDVEAKKAELEAEPGPKAFAEIQYESINEWDP